MNKITTDHLSRAAYVYVRQSTPGQLINNPESRRRQYALAERAKALGWRNVVVVDEDLGHSGGGTARSGFDCLLYSGMHRHGWRRIRNRVLAFCP